MSLLFVCLVAQSFGCDNIWLIAVCVLISAGHPVAQFLCCHIGCLIAGKIEMEVWMRVSGEGMHGLLENMPHYWLVVTFLSG